MATSPSSEPVLPRESWHDTPVCHLERGGLPCGGPLTAADPGLTDGELICCACGRKTAATPDEVAQAKRADAAWEVECERQHPNASIGEFTPSSLRCQECGETGAKACSYKCGAVLCEAHGAEHHPPDCPPQMDEYLRDIGRMSLAAIVDRNARGDGLADPEES